MRLVSNHLSERQTRQSQKRATYWQPFFIYFNKSLVISYVLKLIWQVNGRWRVVHPDMSIVFIA